MPGRLALFLLGLLVGSPLAAQNLLRNGSFEGSLRYWHDTKDTELVRDDAAHGAWALRVGKRFVQSAAFTLVPGKPVTISFAARADAPATMGWQCTPCAREIGARLGQTWGLRARHPVRIGTTWQRYSATFTPTAAQDGLWPRPTYMLQLGDGDRPCLLDAVCVSYAPDAAWQPWRAVEVLVDCPDLPGYRDPRANLLDKGQSVKLVGSVFNPGAAARASVLRFEFLDYEGERVLGPNAERAVVAPPGQSATARVKLALPANGTVLARCTALVDGQVVDRSDLPLTSLPHPMAATRPDPRERFGGSLWGPHIARQHQRLGLAWTRWHPHMNWADHQPEGPDKWRWFDDQLDMLAAHGISTHAVLYGKPKWAFGGDAQLPRDMQWPATDPRWDDLTPQCGWDRFVVEAVRHYRGRALVYEIENEPELDGWNDKADLYVRFTTRTARLIKQTDPQAKVMVDNVYGIPSGLNRRLLEQGAAKWLDIISWHDYHEGWLADAAAIRRMRLALDALGGQHVEIWFNEGWAYTNTAVDEPAVALTNLTSAQSTNALVASVAELTANGQDKTILFHTGYETHGMSFWDYCGPGTMLWDYYDYPLPLIPAWNTLAHHLGLSRVVGFTRPPRANFCVFDDLRNGRGVMVAYADRDAPADVAVELPFDGLLAEDAMGNAAPLATRRLVLARGGRPVFLYADDKRAGATFLAGLEPLDRKHASFVTRGGAGGPSWALPATWVGSKRDASDGNPALAEGQPVWRLDQLWPTDALQPGNWRPLVWRDGWWLPLADTFGGQPKAELRDGGLRLEFRGAHGQPAAPRQCALAFRAPQAGVFSIGGSAALRLWDGNLEVRLRVLHKTRDAVKELAALRLARNANTPLLGVRAELAAGDELVLLPQPGGPFVGGDVTLRDLRIGLGESAPVGGGASIRLPAAWDGTMVGRADGNPLLVAGQPVWRLDQLWPDQPAFVTSYTPLPWAGTEWKAKEHEHGGQPAVRVSNGAVAFAVRGPWTGQPGQKTAALVYCARRGGVHIARGLARSKPWEGAAKVFRLALLKKDTQRAAELQVLELPRDGAVVPFELSIDLAPGHELLFLPLMPDWHNATTTTISELVVEEPAG